MVVSAPHASLRWMVVCLAVLLVACTSATEPHFQVVAANVGPLQLDTFHSVLRDSGVIVVSSRLVDTLANLDEHQLIAATLTTSRGDSESLFLGRDICGSGGVFHLCRGLLVSMTGTAQVASLFSQMEAVPARLTSVSVSGRLGGVRVLGETPTGQAINSIRGMVAVASVTTDGVGSAGGSSASYRSLLSAAIALDGGAPVAHDGRVQAQSGDTVVVAGIGSGGITVKFSVVLP